MYSDTTIGFIDACEKYDDEYFEENILLLDSNYNLLSYFSQNMDFDEINVICEKFNFTSLEFQSLEGIIKAIGLEPCELCTYCWNGKE